jgi:hypothetical protein
MDRIVRNLSFGVHIFQIPAKRLALELLSQFNTTAHIANLDSQIGHDSVKVGLELVGPDVNDSELVLKHDILRTARERVR